MALGGNEVGRVTVRVSPNLGNFRSEVERALKGIPDAKVKIDVDTDGLRQKISAAVKEASAGQEVNIDVDVDSDHIGESIGRATKRIKPVEIPIDLDEDRLKGIFNRLKLDPVKINFDTSGFSDAAIKARKQAADLLERQSIRVKLDAQSDALRAEIAKVKAELTDLSNNGADIRLKADTAKLTADIRRLKSEIAGLNSGTVNIRIAGEIQEKIREVDRLELTLKKLDRSHYKPEIDIAIAKALAEIRALSTALSALDRKKVKLGVDLDQNLIGKAFNVLTATASTAAEAAGKALSTGLGVAGDAVEGVTSSLTKMGSEGGSSLTQMVGKAGMFGQAFQMVGQLIQAAFMALVVIPGIATGIAAAGAAIAEVWGLAATAILTVPAAIGLIGAPIAAVMLGMDGIKKAAKALQPEFDALKAAISGTFEQKLKPVFENLKTLFPTLTNGLNGIAMAVSFTGLKLSEMFQSIDKAGDLKVMLDNIGTAIVDMTPGVTALIGAFTRLAFAREAIQVLVVAVSTLGFAFNDMVNKLFASGTLDAAFKGLQGTMMALSNAFVGLVNNGIRLFSTAAPGLNKTITSITNFFGRFDWERLGGAVSRVFEGISKAIDSIPPGTIETITQSFERMGEAFNSAEFQRGAANIVQMVSNLISIMPQLIGVFGSVATAAYGFGQVFQGLAPIFEGAFHLITGNIPAAIEAWSRVPAGLEKAKEGFTNLGQGIRDGIAAAHNEMTTGAATLKADAGSLVSSIGLEVTSKTPLIVGQVTNSAGQVADAFKLPDGKVVSIPPQWRGMGSAIGLQGVAGVQEQLPLVQNQATILSESFKPAPGTAAWVPPQWRNLGQSATGAAAGSLQEGTPLVGSAADILGQATAPPPGQDLKQPWEAGTTPIPGAVGSALAPLPGAVQQPLDAAGASVTAGTANWSKAITDGVTNMTNNVRTGFESMGTVFDTAMIGGDQRIAAATTNWSTLMRNGLTAMTTEVTNGFTQMGTQFDTAMVGGDNRILAATQNWTNLMRSGLVAMTTEVTTGFTNMGTQFDTALVGGDNRISAATAHWQELFNTGFTNINTVVQTAFTSIGTTIVNALTQINGAFAGFGQALVGFNAILQGSLMGWTAFTMGILTAGQGIYTVLQGILQAFVGFGAGLIGFNAVLAGSLAGFAAFTNGLMTAGAGVMAALRAIIQGFVAFSAALSAASSAIAAGSVAIGQSLANGMRAGVQAVTAGTQAMAQGFRGILDAMRALVAGISAGMQAGATAALNGMRNIVNAVKSGLQACQAAAGAFRAAGANMGQALADGLNSKVGAVESAARRLADAARAAAEAAAQIHSPSRVFLRIGGFVGQGFVLGISDYIPVAETQAKRMVSTVRNVAMSAQGIFNGIDLGSMETSDIDPGNIAQIRGLAESEMNGTISSDGFGGLEDRVTQALEGWSVEMDSTGLAKLVNNANTRKARRR